MTQQKDAQRVEDDPRAVRLAKRQALIDAGENPYGHAFTLSCHVADLNKKYADLSNGESTDDVVQLAGRIMSIRDQGKLMFMTIRENGDDLQLFCQINRLGEQAFSKMKQLDVGDWIGFKGNVVRTRRGQLSVALTSFELLSKSVRPLPEKFHGLSDKETRYRQRYVDLVMNPDVRKTFVKRFAILRAIREFMDNDRGFYEVETPILQSIMGGANAKPFITHFNALDRDYYLRIATELPLKRLLVGGFERVYEIGRIFRNEGMDPYHNPEFTTIEAYQAFSDLHGMMDLTQHLFQAAARAACGTLKITYQGTEIDLGGTWPHKSMIDLATEAAGEPIDFTRSLKDLRAIAKKDGIKVEEQWGKGKLISEIFEQTCEEKLVQPIFVTGHPLEISPLAKKDPENPEITQRFELYICGHEYANAFSELNDPVDQAQRFRAQVAQKDFDDEAMGFDADYVRALEYGMPPAGGVGIGIDRMVMLLTDQPSIRDVLLFPHMREEGPEHIEGITPEDAKEMEASQAHMSTQPHGGQAADDAKAEAQDEFAQIAAKLANVPAPKPGEKLDAGITRDAAFELLKKYNQKPFHIKHGKTLEALMRYYAAQYDPDNVDFWGIVGLLHDLDWERWENDQTHTLVTAQLLDKAGANPVLARAIATHNSDLVATLPKPEAKMEKVLYACDELSGLIQAAVLVRPSKSVMDFTVKSLKKKFKDKHFAAGCNRDVISHGADLMGMTNADLFESVITAMKAIDATINPQDHTDDAK